MIYMPESLKVYCWDEYIHKISVYSSTKAAITVIVVSMFLQQSLLPPLQNEILNEPGCIILMAIDSILYIYAFT